MSQAVRDLLWVVNCPSFVCGDNVAPPATLTTDDIDASSLHAFLVEQGDVHRVGRYFERLVQYWLVQVCRFARGSALLANSILSIATMTERSFIVRSRSSSSSTTGTAE
jgi:hypothetical protein